MFAQSSIHQLKLKKESEKFHALLFDEAQGDDTPLMQTNNWVGGDLRSTRPPSMAGVPI
jgi:hypothetical protein